MKGISTILATILIVIIVVALVSLTYTFAVGLFSTSAGGATAGTEALTKRLQQSVEFVGATCSASADNVNFTIRHSGTVAMISGDLTALVNGAQVTTDPSIATTAMNKGDVKSFGYHSATDYTSGMDVAITVSAPAGAAVKTVTCS
jgi:FlaG/FlaF family flagellin (archaellin)